MRVTLLNIVVETDRYFSICYPINSQTWTIKRVHFMVSVAWLLSFVFSIPQLIFFSYMEMRKYFCFVTDLSVMVVMTISGLHLFYSSVIHRYPDDVAYSSVGKTKYPLTVVTCYLLCWGPFFVAQMWMIYDFNSPLYMGMYHNGYFYKPKYYIVPFANIISMKIT
jgi:hypothetical protein